MNSLLTHLMTYKFQNPAVFLIGPTASGKTDTSIQLAEKYPFEIISVDSAMVFKDMDIGTCKPSKQILERVPHHLIDLLKPDAKFNVGLFLKYVESAVKKIIQNKKIPLFVGGTMMFHKVLFDGIHNFPRNEDLREEINLLKKNNGYEFLLNELKQLDPETFQVIDIENPRRVERALEIIKLTKTKLSLLKKESPRKFFNSQKCLILGINDSKQALDKGIEKRLQNIVDNGFLNELENLINTYKLTVESHSMNSINYKQFFPHAVGAISLDNAFQEALCATKKLVKTQQTWMKKFDITLTKIGSDQNETAFFSDTIETYLKELK